VQNNASILRTDEGDLLCLLVQYSAKMIRSGRRGEKEGTRERRGEGNTWEIKGGWSGRREKLREVVLTGDL
jgi:hypothetical protein